MVTDFKLNDRNINGDLLKYLAKTQSDEQPGIRTNTTICLGKIAKHLGVNVPPPQTLEDANVRHVKKY
jgi:hypothetical protein